MKSIGGNRKVVFIDQPCFRGDIRFRAYGGFQRDLRGLSSLNSSELEDVSENLEKLFMITGCPPNGMEIPFMISQEKMLLDMQWAPTWEMPS